jgi:uncharacterized repeat protein (TIGR03803 family)
MKLRLALSLSLSVLLLFGSDAIASEKVLYIFQGGSDGSRPNGPLVSDASGNLYGTTLYGGSDRCPMGCGTVFELSLDEHDGWTETVLYRFTGGTDGQNPYGGLLLDGQGNLYGTTLGAGGSCAPRCGSAFELSPGTERWTITVLHAFKGGKDGGDLVGGLSADSAGNLYGSSLRFGPKGSGTTFRLSRSGNGWALKTLRAFGDDQHGSSPQGPLIVNPAGTTIYGAASYGGSDGYGLIYSLTLNSEGQWTEKLPHVFPGGKGGGNPIFGLSTDSAGNLYGIATNTAKNLNLVYQLSSTSQGKWMERTIYRFNYLSSGQPDSAGGNVFVDQAGDVFGFGGGGSGGKGTIYKLSQPGGKWTETLLYSFVGTSGGVLPWGPPIMDGDGNLYGVTVEGGSGCSGDGCGVVFEFTP